MPSTGVIVQPRFDPDRQAQVRALKVLLGMPFNGHGSPKKEILPGGGQAASSREVGECDVQRGHTTKRTY